MNNAWTVSPAGAADIGEAVTVAMDGEYIVLRPRSVVDRQSTTAFAEALSGALETGSIVRVDAGGERDELIRDAWCPIHGPIEQVAAALEPRPSEPTFHVFAVGVIGVPTSGSWWMIDIGRQRFCRTAVPLDLRFLDRSAWSSVRTIWISETMMSVLTSDGSFVTTARGHVERQFDSRCLHAS